jgi:aminoglycoside/choline kinase family phosphotransferase
MQTIAIIGVLLQFPEGCLCYARNKDREYSMLERENALKEWLNQIIPQKNLTITPLTGDASFRRYYRLQYNGISRIVMDAPPGKEDLQPFIDVAQLLTQFQVLTPEIMAKDITQGFLLLSDFGDQLLLDTLRADTADNYYKEAIDTLFKMQQCPANDPILPPFNKQFMLSEMQLCNEWFLSAYLSLQLSDKESLMIKDTMDWIATEVAQQPLTFIHRDYHSRNLMWVTQPGQMQLGVIDFQDAMCGPFTYDLVSLLKDCYISWPRERVLAWVNYFYTNMPQHHGYSQTDFIRAFDLCGLQRHLKVLGIFSRLHLRDGKRAYLDNLPLTLKYVLECTETYKELHPLYDMMQKRITLP